MTATPTIAVHAHIYYTGQWRELRTYLRRLRGLPHRLFITLTEAHPSLIRKIQRFDKLATIWIVENRGYDVGPFIYFLHRIDPADYELILKIHTKGDSAKGARWACNRYLGRSWWRTLLLQALLGSRRQVRANIRRFRNDAHLGMLGSRYLLESNRCDGEAMQQRLYRTMEQMGYTPREAPRFVAGTMFMVRSSLLLPIREHFDISDFRPSQKGVHDGTLAHILERLFGALICARGFTIQGVGRNRLYELVDACEKTRLRLCRACVLGFHRAVELSLPVLIQKKTTRKRVIFKFCGIPLFYRRHPQG